jgi:hypothetical protein
MDAETFEISIEAWPGEEMVADDYLFSLAHAIEIMGGYGSATSVGGLTGGIGATFAVGEGYLSDDPFQFSEVCQRGLGIFREACDKVGIRHGGIAKVEVFTGTYLDRELEQEPEGFVGVTEIARELGVSRQRVSELRGRADFPAPVAELAAGPVWKLSNLKRFIREWPRKPGRPRGESAA